MSLADKRPSPDLDPSHRGSAGAVGRAAWLLALVGTFVSPPMANAGAAIALLCVLASPRLRGRAMAIARMPVAFACAALVAWMLLSAVWSQAEWSQRVEAVFDWRTLLILLTGFVLFSEDRQRRRFAVGFVSIAAAAALFVLFSWATGFWPLTYYTPGLLFRNWVTQTMTFGAAALVAAGLLIDRAVTADSGRPEVWLRVWLGVALAALLACIASISIGRSAVLLMAGGLVVLLLHARHARAKWIILAVLVVGVVVAIGGNTLMKRHIVSGMKELAGWQSAPMPTSGGLRVHMWVNALELIRERPLIGYGAGGFAPAYEQLVAQRYQGWRAAPTTDPHNQYLRVAAEYGVVGLLLFLGVLGAAALGPQRMPWRGIGRALLAGWVLTSLLNSHFQTMNEGHMIFILLGAFLAPEEDVS